jgi:hypothetical protein
MPAESFRAVRARDARAHASAGWTMLILALESASEAREQTKRSSLAWLRDLFSEIGQLGR